MYPDLLQTPQSQPVCTCRYVEGVSFEEAYRLLEESKGSPDYSERWLAAGKLFTRDVLLVSIPVYAIPLAIPLC